MTNNQQLKYGNLSRLKDIVVFLLLLPFLFLIWLVWMTLYWLGGLLGMYPKDQSNEQDKPQAELTNLTNEQP